MFLKEFKWLYFAFPDKGTSGVAISEAMKARKCLTQPLTEITSCCLHINQLLLFTNTRIKENTICNAEHVVKKDVENWIRLHPVICDSFEHAVSGQNKLRMYQMSLPVCMWIITEGLCCCKLQLLKSCVQTMTVVH